MVIDAKCARTIGKEVAKAVLQSNARLMRLDVASAIYGPSVSTLTQAMRDTGDARLRVKRRKRDDGKGRMVLVHREEMERWIEANFEDAADADKKAPPAAEPTGGAGK